MLHYPDNHEKYVILLGLDYIYIAKNGTIIIYDDSPESLAAESINIITVWRKINRINGHNEQQKFKNKIKYF